ncbi:MAG: hypothetical protein CMJ90_13665 [Planctomycetes bacterium]|nr:hypothetical protein [Planctomycetota bacterium]
MEELVREEFAVSLQCRMVALFVLPLCCSVHAQVQTWIYDFETPGLLPHDATSYVSWESQNGAPTNGSPSPMARVANGLQEQRLTAASCGFVGGRGMFYAGDRASVADPHVTPSVVNAAWDCIIEARVRFLAFESGLACAILLMEDQSGRYGIWFAQDGLRILGPNTLILYSSISPGFAAGQFHTYRVESDGGSFAMRVLVDGAVVWTGFAPGTTTRNTVMWGDGSSAATNDADADWDWVRAYNGPGLFSSPPQWQTNQAGATLTVNNGTSDVYAPVRHAECVGNLVTITADSSSFGLPWEIGYTISDPGLPASAGGMTLPGGQIANVDLGAPSFTYLNGLTLAAPFSSTLSIPLGPPGPLTATGQLLVVDPSQVTGFSLSALLEVSFSDGGTISGVARGDDKSTVIPITRPPLCSPTAITFAGQLYTQLSISANGMISFGGSNSSPLPGPTAFTNLPAIAGFWADLDNRPSAAGNDVTISQTGGVIRVSWINLPSFGQAGTASSVDVVFDTTTGATIIESYSPDPGHLGSSLVGLTPGMAATNPGPVSFSALVGSGGTAGISDMVYELAAGGPVAGGFSQVIFPLSGPTAYVVN